MMHLQPDAIVGHAASLHCAHQIEYRLRPRVHALAAEVVVEKLCVRIGLPGISKGNIEIVCTDHPRKDRFAETVRRRILDSFIYNIPMCNAAFVSACDRQDVAAHRR